MAINMAAAPISTQGDGDVVNTRYYGTYATDLQENKIIIDSNGCRLVKYFRGDTQYPYPFANTGYTKTYTINLTKFTATFSKSQVTWVNSNGVIGGSPSSDYPIQGKVEERDEPYAPRRIYIIADGFTYWRNV